jgi:hypothetical protein
MTTENEQATNWETHQQLLILSRIEQDFKSLHNDINKQWSITLLVISVLLGVNVYKLPAVSNSLATLGSGELTTIVSENLATIYSSNSIGQSFKDGGLPQ